MSMFHIQFPKRHGFLTWDEMGSLARALGFQVDLFKSHVTDEIIVENDGMLIQEILKMMEYKLLHRPLHLTINMHTAEWNMSAIRKCLYLLDHRALTFEELHNIRMAYQVYEAGDMKGMAEDEHTLLRTLKMCCRTIAPMKLMHRVKHMKINFEEKGRIQLSEFMDLVLWCDVYQAFNPEDMEYSEGKDDELFKLVDFQRLLSHHDDRIMWSLNADFIKDECGFEREQFSTKRLPKEPPVRNQGRIKQLEDRKLCDEFIEATEVAARHDKRRYRNLKYEVVSSQKRVYRAHAGSIRPRPVTVPHLDSFRNKLQRSNTTCSTAEQAYKSFRKRVRSVTSRGSTLMLSEIHSDRPQAEEYVRVGTPRAVSCTEMTEIENKMESLKFAMTTMESRYLIKKEEEMDEFIPGYKEMIANRPSPPPTPEPKPEPKKEIHWTEDVIRDLTSPTFKIAPAHARKCDARFRGWQPVRRKRGSHFILVSPFYENSNKGIFFQRLYDKSRSQVQHVKDLDFLYRYTHKSEVDRGKGLLSKMRPITAPAAIQESLGHADQMDSSHAHLTSRSSGSGGGETGVSKGSMLQEISTNQDSGQMDLEMEDDVPQKHTIDQIRLTKSPCHKISVGSVVKSPRVTTSVSTSRSSSMSSHSKKSRKLVSAAGESRMYLQSQDFDPDSQHQKDTDNKSNSGYSEFEENLEPYDAAINIGSEDRRASGAVKTALDEHVNNGMDEEVIPVPAMQHSKPQIVEIGQIGKISLLEKIAESQDLEARYSQNSSTTKGKISSTSLSGSSNSVPCESEEHNEQENRHDKQASSIMRQPSYKLPLVKRHDSSLPMSPMKERIKSSTPSKQNNQVMSQEQVPNKAFDGLTENKQFPLAASEDTLMRSPQSQITPNIVDTTFKPDVCTVDDLSILSHTHFPPLNIGPSLSNSHSQTNSPISESHSSQNKSNSGSQKQVHIQEPESFWNIQKSDTNNKPSYLDSHDASSDQPQPEGKYWRLVERMDKQISDGLRIRLLTVNK